MFKELLWASLSGGQDKETSLIISTHLGTLSNLIGGQGLEFQPKEDPTGQRLLCLKKILDQTSIQGFLEDIYRKSMGTGEVLLWLRLTETGYRIRYYHFDEFVPYFKPDSDDLQAAIIKYQVSTDQGKKNYRVLVDSTGYYTTEDANTSSNFALSPSSSGTWANLDPSKYTFNPHPLPFLPLYLIRNKPTGPGSRAIGDFAGLESEILAHHAVSKAVSKNVKKFARQTILTNLKRSDLMKTDQNPVVMNLPSYRAGFRPVAYDGNKVPDEEIAEYIGVDGLPGETFVQPIDWNPINSDQLTYVKDWAEQLYSSLSSISKIGGNTAYETRAMLSIPLATANRKSHLIFNEAICRLLADALTHEASLFRCPDSMERGVLWRRIELVEPTTRDQLDISILTRNLSEQGVGDSELLKLQFPGRTEEDIKRITGGAGGIPYRKIDKTVPAVQQLLDLAGTVVDPDIQLRLYDLASSLVSSLEDSLNYGKSNPVYTPGLGLPYAGYQSQSPEPQPLGASRPGIAADSSQGDGIDSPESTPGSNPSGPSNPFRDFFRGVWKP